MNLDRVIALLEEARGYFDAGEQYAHHARRHVEAALQELNRIRKERDGNAAVKAH